MTVSANNLTFIWKPIPDGYKALFLSDTKRGPLLIDSREWDSKGPIHKLVLRGNVLGKDRDRRKLMRDAPRLLLKRLYRAG